jgi:hypothetical protein
MRVVLTTLCVTIMVAAGLAAQPQSREPIVTLIGPPPPVPSLRDLVGRSPVIVVGFVERTGPPGVARGSAVTRMQTVRVVEVLKSHSSHVHDGAVIQLELPGGTFLDKTTGQEYRTNFDIDPLAKGEEAVFFLQPHDNASRPGPPGRILVLSAGYHSVFPKVAGSNAYRLPPSGRGWPETLKKASLQQDELLTMLRSLIAAQ